MPSVSNENLDKAIFSRLVGVGIIVAFYETIYYCFFSSNPGIRWWTSPLTTLVNIFFYYLIIRIDNFEKVKFAFFPVLYFIIFLDYFVNGGFWGIVPLDMAIFFLFTTCLYTDRWLYIFLSLDALMVIVCIWIHYNHPEWAPDVHHNYLSPLDIMGILSRIFILGCFGWIIKVQYDRKIDRIVSLNQELEEKNEEIMIQREEIMAANETLSEKVIERTEKLQKANHQLSEYAFFNSHKVRGPLARIIGLNNIIQMHYQDQDYMDNPEIKIYLDFLERSTSELDQVIFDINELLKKGKT